MNTNFDFNGLIARLYKKISAEEADATSTPKDADIIPFSGVRDDSAAPLNTNFDFSGRLARLNDKISAEEVDAVLITKDANVTYFSGFRGDSAALFVGNNFRKLVTDGRYTEQAQRQSKNFQVVEHSDGLFKKIVDEIKSAGVKKIGVEATVMTVAQRDYLARELDGVEFKSLEFDTLRQVKDAAEIEMIRKACEIADNAFTKVLEVIRPNVREIEIAAELEYFMRKLGSERAAFDTIVASGIRGSLPHGIATEKKICAGELVTMDFGATFCGYCSDITRTVAVGKISPDQKKIYDAVHDAQLYGLEIITAGKSCKEVDSAVRDRLRDADYGEFFMHSLGHGVGLEIHEEPRLSSLSNCEELLPNMIVTDEPGVYIKNFGGVRIEDTVLVTDGRAETLTRSPKTLIEL
ncbi:MAG: aminopeptidase P family protein [Selenomonadaceae bacterium]|nr:aminopeptidase P family protein [Selenomonadaceae bacterium]